MKTALKLLILLGITGCANYSGLDAESKFSCKAPDGVTCMSVSGIYANAKSGNLPGQKKEDKESSYQVQGSETSNSRPRSADVNFNAPGNVVLGVTPPSQDKKSPKEMSAPNSGAPIRTPERILRVWLAPFEDSEGDLHDQKYFYVKVDSGSWTIEAHRANIRQRFQQVYPLSRNNPSNKKTESDTPAMTPQQAAMSTLPVSTAQQQEPQE